MTAPDHLEPLRSLQRAYATWRAPGVSFASRAAARAEILALTPKIIALLEALDDDRARMADVMIGTAIELEATLKDKGWEDLPTPHGTSVRELAAGLEEHAMLPAGRPERTIGGET